MKRYSRVLRGASTLALVVLLSILAVAFWRKTATVTTDKPDYYPGDIVHITGSGWTPGETVELVVHPECNCGDWTGSAIADDEGNISNSDFVVQDHHLGETFLLTATGLTSGQIATHIFTDSPKVGSVVLGTQTPNPVITASQATYSVTVSRGSGSGSSGSFTANMSVTSVLPSGVTASFSPNPLSFTPSTNAASGTLTLTTTGSTPPGSYPFTVRAATSASDFATTTGTLTVTAANQAPVANNDNYATNEDTDLTVVAPGVLGNDTDPNSNPITAVLVAGPSNGDLTLNPDGSFTYEPDPNYHGPDSFTYRANDGSLNSNIATVNLTVNSVNDLPSATDDNYTLDEDAFFSSPFSVLANDTDVEGALLAQLETPAANGTVVMSPLGTFTYDPNDNFSGSDSFTYRATDSNGAFVVATVYLTVDAVNDVPVAVDNSYATDEDTLLTVVAPGVLGNDNDVDGDDIEATLVSGASNGSVTLNPDGSFTYDPNDNYHGPDSFTYKANDGTADSNVATVNITVNSVNDAPEADDNSYNTDEDTDLIVGAPGVLGNDDDDDGDTLSAILVSGPANGSLTLNADGSFTYDPNDNYHGPDSFTYKANDGTADSNVATVNITVNSVNDAPEADDNSYSTDEDTNLNVGAPGVLGNDDDDDGDTLSAVLVSGPANGSLTLNADGSFSYDPNDNYHGPDSFTYKANDGTADSNVATVNITVNSVNDAPVADDNSYSTDEDTDLNVGAPGVLGNDDDDDGDTLSAVLVSGPANGSLTLNADGSFTYDPNDNYHGPDSFTYKANDGTADSNVATVNITVNSVNDAPVADDNSYSTDEDTNLNVGAPGVLGNDDDVENDTLSAILVSGPANGSLTLNVDGSFTYDPNDNYHGPDSFTYKANDGAADSNVATVNITVNSVNDEPTVDANQASVTVDEGSEATNSGSFDDVDMGDSVTISASIGTVSQSGTQSGTWSWSYTPADGPSAETVTITATDGDGAEDTVTFQLNVDNVAPEVDAGNDQTIDEGDTFSGSGSFSDPGDDVWVGTVDYGDGSGVQPLTLNPDKSFTLSHAYSDNGEFTVTVSVDDGDGGSDSDTLTVTVENVDPDVDAGGNDTIYEGDTFNRDGSFTDPGTDTWTATVDYGDGSGEQPLSLSGKNFSLSHTYADNGTYTVTVKVTDDDGGVGTDTFQVTVNNVAPTVSATGEAQIDENGTLTLSGTITDPGVNDNFTLVVDWGEGTPETHNYPAGTTQYSLTHQYLDDNPTGTASDSYSVQVEVTDKDNDSSNAQHTVTVKNVAPTLTLQAISEIDENGTASLSGSISDPGTQDTFKVTVDWGEGSPETHEYAAGTTSFNLSHQYLDDNPTGTASDDYSVSVRVEDDDAGEDSKNETATVNNVDPTVGLDPVAAIDENGTANLSGSITDPGTQDTFEVEIDWGDGSAVETLIVAAGGTGFNANHQYLDDNPTGTDSDNYTISVKVIDDDTGEGTSSGSVTVRNVAPELNLNAVSAIDENGTASLGGSITDPGTEDTFEVEIDWGDGSAPETVNVGAGETGFSANHQYLDDNPTGTPSDMYSISVTVKDDDTGQDSDSETVTVNNVAPIVNAGDDQQVDEGDTVSLSGLFDDVGTEDSHTFTWSVSADNGQVIADGSGQNFSFVPFDNGTYTITFTVEDDDTGTDSDSVIVTVENVAPDVDAGTDANIDEGATFSGSGSFTDPGSNDTHTATVDYGDGSGVQPLTLNPDKTFDLSHVYADNGSYTVTVVVTDDDGETGSDTLTVNVANVAPIVVISETAIQSQYSDPVTQVTLTGSDPGADELSLTVRYKFASGSFTSYAAYNAANALPDDGSVLGKLEIEKITSGNNSATYHFKGIGDLKPGTWVFDFRFSDEDGGSTVKTLTLVVDPEDALAEYSGLYSFSTPSANSNTANVTLRATIRDPNVDPTSDPYDDDAGLITRAKVNFINRSSGMPINPAPINVTLVNAGETRVGYVEYSTTFSLNSSSVGEDVQIGIQVCGYYDRESADDDFVITISRPGPGFITGGGYLLAAASSGAYASDLDSKLNFGFNAKPNKSNKNIQGRLTAIIRKGGRNYQIKSTSIASLTTVVATGKATFLAKANLTDVTDPYNPIAIGGNLTLEVTMTDAGEPGVNDTIGISLWTSGGGLLHSSRWNGIKTIEQLLKGGNLQVR